MLFHCLTNDSAEELPSVLLLFSFCFVALEKIVSPFLKGQWKTVNAPKVGSSGMISASTHLLAMDPIRLREAHTFGHAQKFLDRIRIQDLIDDLNFLVAAFVYSGASQL